MLAMGMRNEGVRYGSYGPDCDRRLEGHTGRRFQRRRCGWMRGRPLPLLLMLLLLLKLIGRLGQHPFPPLIAHGRVSTRLRSVPKAQPRLRGALVAVVARGVPVAVVVRMRQRLGGAEAVQTVAVEGFDRLLL